MIDVDGLQPGDEFVGTISSVSEITEDGELYGLWSIDLYGDVVGKHHILLDFPYADLYKDQVMVFRLTRKIPCDLYSTLVLDLHCVPAGDNK